MKHFFKHPPMNLVFSSILSIVLINTLACKPSNPFIDTPISGAKVIDTSEQEIIFNKPFKPKKMINKICFEYSDKLTAEPISEPPKFSDGTTLQLTAVIVDQNDRKYELDHVENSVENYLCIRPKYDAWLNISKTDTTFVKLLIRSNRKINLLQIQWVSYDIWDI